MKKNKLLKKIALFTYLLIGCNNLLFGMEHIFLPQEQRYNPPQIPQDLQQVISYFQKNPTTKNTPPVLITSPRKILII